MKLVWSESFGVHGAITINLFITFFQLFDVFM